MQTAPSRPVPLHVMLCAVLGGVLVVLVSCDSSGSKPSLEPQFDVTIGDPVGTSLKGAAAFGSNLSADEQGIFTLPIEPFGKTITVIQLSGETEAGVVHDLSFLHFADGSLQETTYEVGHACEGDCAPGSFPPEELFLADYVRQTVDSLHSHPIDSGTVTIETVTEEGARGTFTLSSTVEVSSSRAAVEAFLDSLRSGSRLTPTEMPSPPPTDLQVLEQPLTIEGRFTATSGHELSEQVPHLPGMGLGLVSDTTLFRP